MEKAQRSYQCALEPLSTSVDQEKSVEEMSDVSDEQMRALCESEDDGAFVIAARSWIPKALERLAVYAKELADRTENVYRIRLDPAKFYTLEKGPKHYAHWTETPPPPSSGALPEVGENAIGGGASNK